jgi:DNA replication protein DnaC
VTLEDTYLRELLARLDAGDAPLNNSASAICEEHDSMSDKSVVAVASLGRPNDAANRASADAALEERLAALRDKLSAIAGESSSGDTQSKATLTASPNNSSVDAAKQGSINDFTPPCPNTLAEVGLEKEQIEAIVLKYLFNRGNSAGRQLGDQLGLPFSLIEKILFALKVDQLVVQKGAAPLSDYVYQLTPQGLEDAKRHYKSCSYYGTLPVPLEDYIASVKAQSIRHLQPTAGDLACVFKDLLVSEQLQHEIGQAVHAGKGFFLYGAPGNGKTSVAERVARAFGQYIWIPRTIGIAGEIVRLFDPCNHEEAPPDADGPTNRPFDRRWVRIRRPTVIAGGELTMDRLEITVNKATGVNEAPLQLKSNCGVLVIDDFGRQRMSVSELLNRWIVPLDRRYDFLNLPSGKTIQVPFDQLLVFSTNLEPRDLVDEAFLRRISYKIEVPDPSLDDFRRLIATCANREGFAYDESAVEHLIREHYLLPKRPVRACHARDLLDHVRSYCGYRSRPLAMSREAFDAAVKNYFGLMG